MKKVEYSQIVRRKLKALRVRLTSEFGSEVSRKILRQITNAARDLENFAEKGVSVSSMYDIDCDYRYLYVGHNYLFYRIKKDNKISGTRKAVCISFLKQAFRSCIIKEIVTVIVTVKAANRYRISS